MNRTLSNLKLKPKPEKTLLNEIAHLSNLLQCSKPVHSAKVQNVYRKKNHFQGNYRLTWPNRDKSYDIGKSSNSVTSKTFRPKRSPVMNQTIPPVDIVVETSSNRPTVQTGSRVVSSVDSSEEVSVVHVSTPPKIVNEKHPRYYAVVPKSSPVQKIVQRRLPPNVVQIQLSNRDDNLAGELSLLSNETLKEKTRVSCISYLGASGNKEQVKEASVICSKDFTFTGSSFDEVASSAESQVQTVVDHKDSSILHGSLTSSVIDPLSSSSGRSNHSKVDVAHDGFLPGNPFQNQNQDSSPGCFVDSKLVASEVVEKVVNAGVVISRECATIDRDNIQDPCFEKHDQASRRTRLLTKVSKLSSYKRRLAEDKSAPSQMPSYFPC